MTPVEFSAPRGDRYFEDYVVGATYESAVALMQEDDIIAFARAYDPQPMHVDRAAAAEGPFGGVIASGWHTLSTMMRLFTDSYLSAVASLPSPGVDEVRWVRPVRPGDALRLRMTTLESRRSQSKPDRGLVRTRLEALNQRDEVVASMVAMNFVLLRAG